MPFKKIITLVLSVLMLLCVISGCDYEDDFALYFELSEEPGTLDPQLASTPEEEIIVRNLFEGLYRLDEEGKAVKGAAEEISISDDGLKYTFKIRDNAKWQDESPLTAEDFVLALKRALEPKTKSPKATLLYCIKNAEAINTGKGGQLGVKAIDSKTLEITLTEKTPDFPELLTSSVAMPCNSSVFNSARGRYGLNSEDISCNGSFYLKKWEKGETFSIRINKNEVYNGEFKSNASAVIFNKGDINDRAKKISEAHVDFGFINKSGGEANFNSHTFSRTHYALIINKSSDVGDINFRKAFETSINRSAIIPDTTNNVFMGSSTLLPKAVELKGRELKGLFKKNNISPSPKDAYNSYLKGIKEVGNPQSITILYSGDENTENVVRLLAEDFQNSLGAVINLKQVESDGALRLAVAAGEYQLAFVPITVASHDPISYLSKFISGSSENIFGFSNKGYDKLATGLTPLCDSDTILSSTQKALRIIENEHYIIPIADSYEAFGYSKSYSCPDISPFNGTVDLALVDLNKKK